MERASFVGVAEMTYGVGPSGRGRTGTIQLASELNMTEYIQSQLQIVTRDLLCVFEALHSEQCRNKR